MARDFLTCTCLSPPVTAALDAVRLAFRRASGRRCTRPPVRLRAGRLPRPTRTGYAPPRVIGQQEISI
jgi:hypothetical protein